MTDTVDDAPGIPGMSEVAPGGVEDFAGSLERLRESLDTMAEAD